jgi:hypothetical protein
MRSDSKKGFHSVRFGLIALVLLTLAAGEGAAQMVFDGNVVFNNNATGTLVGQFSGASSAGPTCAVGLTPGTLGTVTYTHNTYGDPLLPDAPYKPNVVPNWRPAPGSPAFTATAVRLPADGFFEPTCYAGAIAPSPAVDWTLGWTYYDSTGATRQDLHLAGMPNPRPLAIRHNINLYSSQTWSPDSNYEVRGQLRVKDQATLTIPAGVVVFGDRATLGTIIVERGGKIVAVGTASAPIIMTSNDPPGTQVRGGWGGLIVHGRAKTNAANSCLGDSAASEGGLVGYYGGNDDNDDSGELRYVRVEYSGKQITDNNELNSFTFNAVGRGTQLEYLQAHRGADDGIEFFGGTADLKHALATDGTDDGYDTQMGYRGRAQFVVVRVTAEPAPPVGTGTPQFGEKGIEADNNETNHNETQCSGYSYPVVANFTFIGDKRSGTSFPGSTSAVNFRRGTAFQVMNSICANFKTAALRIDDNSTWEHHCAALPAPPTACSNVGVPVSSGQVFVTFGAPNPFRDDVSFHFALPQAGPVRVEVFTPSGRRVATLTPGTLPAGRQTVTWHVDRGTPAGVYFYKIFAEGAQSAGKILRVD